MRRSRTLREILLETLAVSPLAFSALGGGCTGGYGYFPCGTHIVIMEAADGGPDGGLNCSPCQGAISCTPVSVNGTTELACNVSDFCPSPPGGRRPEALLARRRTQSVASAGGFFAAAARLEAASVMAFNVLAKELSAHGAPAKLVNWCARSAVEEQRHTALTASLARRYGAEPEHPEYAAPRDVRTLEAIASENAVEGCARESYGAALAGWQAVHAGDPAVVATMTLIAGDESRHAELAWAVAEWSARLLTRAATRRTREAQIRASEELIGEVTPRSRLGRVQAGLPSVEQQSELALRFAAAMRDAV